MGCGLGWRRATWADPSPHRRPVNRRIGQLGGTTQVQYMERSLQLSKVERLVVADGDWYEISCAVKEDGSTSPAANLLDELEQNMWPDPEADALPDEYQVGLRQRLLASIEQLAETGDLPRGSYNSLHNGLWEFKPSNLRLTFFDTDGKGAFEPKLGEKFSSWSGKNEYLLADDFDEFIRLGHCFAKTSEQTTQEDLDLANQLRIEDLTHDC